MTRERARTERRDLDKERGEPVAGAAPRGGPGRCGRIARPLRDWTTPAADPHHERRRRRVARAARAQAGARPDRRHHGRRARHEPERGRPPEDADAPAPRPGADARRRLARLLGRRLARPTRSASPSSATSATASTSSRRASTTARTSATTSRIRGRSARRWRRSSTAARPSRSGRSTTSIPTSRWRPSRRTAVARNILEHGLSRGELINVNVPAVTPEECEGFEVTRLGRRVYQDQLIERLDPRGIPYFWIGGPPPSGLAVPGTDFHAVVNRRIAITPDPSRPDRPAPAQAAPDLGVAARG